MAEFKVGDRVFYRRVLGIPTTPNAGTVVAVREAGRLLIDLGPTKYTEKKHSRNRELTWPEHLELIEAPVIGKPVDTERKALELNGPAFKFSRMREIYGARYCFQYVLMPDGERRIYVSRYNGTGEPGFGHAWSPVHFLSYPAEDN